MRPGLFKRLVDRILKRRAPEPVQPVAKPVQPVEKTESWPAPTDVKPK